MGKSVHPRTSDQGRREGHHSLTPRMRAVVWSAVGVGAAALAVAVALAVTAPAPTAPPASASGPTAGPLPGATPVSGSEVQGAEAGLPTAAPQRLPARAQTQPRVQTPLPATAAADGELVAGFPAELGGPVDGSTVIDSSVTSSGDVLQFALRARSDEGPGALRAAFASRWSAAGLTGAADEGAVTSFADAFSSVSIAVEETGTGSVYTVYGVLKAG